jgi:REP element-mobilizing transposase RayT
MSNLDFRRFYKRNLPHIQLENSIYAVSFRLAFSLPKHIIKQLKEEKIMFEKESLKLADKELQQRKSEFYQKHFEHFDDFLGKYEQSPFYLKNDEIAQLVSESIHFWKDKRYKLYAYCIMPNHVHLLIQPLGKSAIEFFSISEILSTIKRRTAKQANLILNREGQFWQHENYDHLIRDDKEFYNQFYYVIKNPVKAGLVKEWSEWKYTWHCGLIENVE